MRIFKKFPKSRSELEEGPRFLELFTPFILLDFPIHIDTINMDLSICILRGHELKFLNVDNSFIFANSADPDEMPHHGAFHLDLHCLPKY